MTTTREISDESGTFIDALYARCDQNSRAEAIDLALWYLDDLLSAEKHRECDAVLGLLDPSRLAPSVLVAILGITRRMEYKVGRNRFFAWTMARVEKVKGKRYARQLLEKYR